LALQLCRNFADKGADTAFVEMEMDHEALMTRRLSNVAKVSMHKLMEAKKKLRLEDKEIVAQAHLKRIKDLKRRGVRETFWVPDSDVSMNEVLRTLRPYGFQVIVIDYIGLLAGMDGDDQWKRLGSAVREAKIFANGRCLIVICAQLSDEGAIRYSKQMTEHASNWWKFSRSRDEMEAGCMSIEECKGRNQMAVKFYVKPDLEFMSFPSIDTKEAEKLLKKGIKKKGGIDTEVDDSYYDDDEK
jgi:hypothetical protein